MQEKRFDLVGIGSMVVDFIYRTPRLIGVDEKISLNIYEHGEAVKKFAGGVTLNHLAWASVLGLRVGIFGKQGDDEFGLFLRKGMDLFNIDKHITLDGAASSFSQIFVDDEGERAIYMSRAATAETSGRDIINHHTGYIQSSKILSTEISQLPLDAVIASMEIARSAGVMTVLDIDIPPSDALKILGTEDQMDRALKLADYLKPSKSASIEMTGKQDALQAAQVIRKKYSSKAVIITDGGGGCAIASDEVNDRVPAYKLKAVDTTGAGDAFLGGLMAGLHYGLKWNDILRLANAAGAACCEIEGAVPDINISRKRIFELYNGTRFNSREFKKGMRKEAPPGYENAVGEFLQVSIEELDRLRTKISSSQYFKNVVELISEAESRGGRVHITGIGKPEYVSGYIAALFSSTGTPAYFLHGTECVHGSAGQVKRGDVVIAISNSGQTQEIKLTINALKNNGALIIGVSGNAQSWLAEHSDEFLYAGVKREGSPLNFEPRASILAQIYVLVALSIELQARKKISLADYNSWHPSGNIGEKLRGED